MVEFLRKSGANVPTKWEDRIAWQVFGRSLPGHERICSDPIILQISQLLMDDGANSQGSVGAIGTHNLEGPSRHLGSFGKSEKKCICDDAFDEAIKKLLETSAMRGKRKRDDRESELWGR